MQRIVPSITTLAQHHVRWRRARTRTDCAPARIAGWASRGATAVTSARLTGKPRLMGRDSLPGFAGTSAEVACAPIPDCRCASHRCDGTTGRCSTPHHGLDGVTPLARYQQDLPRIRTLGALATDLDALFHHRVSRQVRRDGTVSYLGAHFEVPYELSGAKVALVVDSHTARVIGVEDAHGKHLGAATPLDAAANLHRVRHRPPVPATGSAPGSTALSAQRSHPTPNLVEIAHAAHYGTPED